MDSIWALWASSRRGSDAIHPSQFPIHVTICIAQCLPEVDFPVLSVFLLSCFSAVSSGRTDSSYPLFPPTLAVLLSYPLAASKLVLLVLPRLHYRIPSFLILSSLTSFPPFWSTLSRTSLPSITFRKWGRYHSDGSSRSAAFPSCCPWHQPMASAGQSNVEGCRDCATIYLRGII